MSNGRASAKRPVLPVYYPAVMSANQDAHFDPDAFEVRDLEHAKHATMGDLAFDNGRVFSCERRWASETDYTIEALSRWVAITPETRILDYGCGTGRIAKGLIERFGCHVTGVDTSASMQQIARQYVNSPKFRIGHPDGLASSPGGFDLAVCVWVLQHSNRSRKDVKDINASLKPSGKLVVLNENGRYVPTIECGFANDGVDVRADLLAEFGPPIENGKLDPGVVPPEFSQRTFWAIYQKRKPMTPRYDPSCFDVRNTPQAKAIILTPEGRSTDERWKHETPYLAELMGEHIDLHARHRVLDYGCGIGRMSKELIQRYGCSVVGVDTSVSMRALACAYVEGHDFLVTPPGHLLEDGVAPCHHALAVWVLQHVPEVEPVIDLIHRKLVLNGKFFVVNMHDRALPMSGSPWHDDGVKVRDLLARRFKELAVGPPDAGRTSPVTAEKAFWGVYQKIG
jgi:2-polyprenyl-3-methyl-5-hydroxy-6-metoxy-1,4-benzoquinol methylase